MSVDDLTAANLKLLAAGEPAFGQGSRVLD
jgi:hypothetical protein